MCVGVLLFARTTLRSKGMQRKRRSKIRTKPVINVSFSISVIYLYI